MFTENLTCLAKQGSEYQKSRGTVMSSTTVPRGPKKPMATPITSTGTGP